MASWAPACHRGGSAVVRRGSDMAGARVQALGADDPTVLGPYRLIGRLASGGMGRIYLARSDGGQGPGESGRGAEGAGGSSR